MAQKQASPEKPNQSSPEKAPSEEEMKRRRRCLNVLREAGFDMVNVPPGKKQKKQNIDYYDGEQMNTDPGDEESAFFLK